MNINIRLAKPSDALDMAKIHALSWEVAYKDIIPQEYIKAKNATRPDLYRRIITDENTMRYVIQINNKTIGIMGIAPPQDDDLDDTFYELHFIYLHPDYFRKGIGTEVLNYAFNKAKELGKNNMVVWVFTKNTNTINFYKKCGFVPEIKTKTYDCGILMDCFRMKKVL